MNYNGEDVELAQHNIDVGVPFVVSTRNYGISGTIIRSPASAILNLMG